MNAGGGASQSSSAGQFLHGDAEGGASHPNPVAQGDFRVGMNAGGGADFSHPNLAAQVKFRVGGI